MLDKRGRDIGEPKILVCYAKATPETVAANRALQTAAQERKCTFLNGYPTRCEILYAAEKPEGYGVPHGDPPPY